MNGSNTYKERNSIKTNQGEEIFLAWCKEQNLVRNLPDFIVTSENKATLVNVKGSLNFKESEYRLIDSFIENFETGACLLYYAFALPSGILWRRASSVKTAYEEATFEGVWPDGKVYRKLDLCGFLDHA